MPDGAYPLVLFVGSLADFMQECPAPGPVWIGLAERACRTHIPQREIQLCLQGLRDGILVVLLWAWKCHWLPDEGKPLGKFEGALYQAIPEIERLLAAHLRTRGYQVRRGTFGFPSSLIPVTGTLEVLDIRISDEGCTVSLKEQEEVQ